MTKNVEHFRGIDNPGSLCYLISITQVLFFLPYFPEMLLKLSHSSSNIVVDSLADILNCLSFMSTAIVDVIPLYSALYGVADGGIFVQQDASDCYSAIIQHISSASKNTFDAGFLDKLMCGELVNTIVEIGGNHERRIDKPENFYYISLGVGSVTGKLRRNLEQSLLDFTASERIPFAWPTNKDDIIPETTDCSPITTRRTLFQRLPKHLFFHLKRFRYNFQRRQKVKIHDYFAFPELLDMSPFVTSQPMGSHEEDMGCMYELTGCVVHAGNSAYSGHYYAFIKNRGCREDSTSAGEPCPAEWHRFDDESVTPFDFADSHVREMFGGEPSDDDDDDDDDDDEGEEDEAPEHNSSDPECEAEVEDCEIDSVRRSRSAESDLSRKDSGCDSISSCGSSNGSSNDDCSSSSSSDDSSRRRSLPRRSAFMLVYDRVSATL